MNPLFTLGHSTQPAERLIDLLRQHGVTAVCDVRSKPYSRMNPQFNREALKATLSAAGIAYVFLGNELGGRVDDPSCYVNGRVQYERVARTPLFAEGMRRLEDGARKYRVALLCAEKDPLGCHRTLLVSRHAHERGWRVNHILYDGSLETHEQALERLLQGLGRLPTDMFKSPASIIAEAYHDQAEAVAFAIEDADAASSG
jgi:uncharacterized protein (DUF488 family)